MKVIISFHSPQFHYLIFIAIIFINFISTNKSLFEMNCIHIWALPKGGEGGVLKACQDGLENIFLMFVRECKGLPGWPGALFSHVCPFDRGVGV